MCVIFIISYIGTIFIDVLGKCVCLNLLSKHLNQFNFVNKTKFHS